jgi:RecA-family ATPase
MLSMQVGMAIANDEDNVLDFKINEKGLKVLYVDTECGIDEMNRRYNLIKKNFQNWHGSDRFIMISRKAKIISDVFDDVEDMLRMEAPDIVYYDCLYNMSNSKDISKNHNLSPITDRITDFKMGYNNTPILIAHATKGNHEQGLTMDRIAGGSHLQNWAEHIVLLTRTNMENRRMLRIDKSRSVGFPTCYYGMEWDGDKFFMENIGVIDNYREWLVSEQKKLMWSEYLNNIPVDTFTTKDWLNEVEIIGGKSISTAKGYLREMVASGVLTTPHKGSGIYTKNMKVIVADNNEE